MEAQLHWFLIWALAGEGDQLYATATLCHGSFLWSHWTGKWLEPRIAVGTSKSVIFSPGGYRNPACWAIRVLPVMFTLILKNICFKFPFLNSSHLMGTEPELCIRHYFIISAEIVHFLNPVTKQVTSPYIKHNYRRITWPRKFQCPSWLLKHTPLRKSPQVMSQHVTFNLDIVLTSFKANCRWKAC
jgi:hypothetical protein